MPLPPARTPPRATDDQPITRRRLGLLGGTFDPPHIGHLVAAVAALDALALDEVWLVVANRPWQKVGERTVSAAGDRCAMVQALTEGVAGVTASRIEIDRGGDSYTADTLAELHRAEPTTELFVILGTDAAAGLPTWERPDDVRNGATIALVARAGAAFVPPPGWTMTRIDMPRLDVSSTDLRRRVAHGEPIAGLVPPGVCGIIRERGLYRGPANDRAG